MSDNRGPARAGILREIAWLELFPWLLLARSFRLSIHPALLGVAFVAAMATPGVWYTGAMLFRIPLTTSAIESTPGDAGRSLALLEATDVMKTLGHCPAAPAAHAPGDPVSRFFHRLRSGLSDPGTAVVASPVVHVYQSVATPIWHFYRIEGGWRLLAFYLFGLLGTLALGGLAGGTISRMAVMDLGRDEQVGFFKAFQMACRRWVELFTAPLYPVLGTVIIALFSVLIGWMLRIDALVMLAGLVWLLVLIGGILSAAMIAWLLLGWPLMMPAIAAEETGDAFDAASRSLSYLTGKPLNYLFYVLVASVLGFIAWAIVDLFLDLILHMTHWSVSWGAGGERINELWYGTGEKSPGTMARIGMGLVFLFEGLIRGLSAAFAYSYFWVSASAIYLLMRHDVDHTEFDEVWSDQDPPAQPLPPQKASEPLPPPETKVEVVSAPPPAPGDLEHNQAE